ncbi:NADH dehydrogenase [ubiquinone] 1 beta subcomplex subunit 8, mitochondrial-like [Dermacentor albipictus]|uniref:NADH dehydrogenase [ubiquinone] 1 beta subcomplex subunit 8, mitochondrial-like n=1 Tax=Dermacentor albipictus TaxID=60249 RepID=UPI0031FD3EBC
MGRARREHDKPTGEVGPSRHFRWLDQAGLPLRHGQGSRKMAALVGRSGRFGQIVRYQLKVPLIASCRSAHWNKDWCPKPAPQTEEELRAAAKKYRMLPEDYKVRDQSEGLTWGDYPKIPTVPAGSRDPEEDYDFPYLRRNYGEPINIYMDAYTLERLDLQRQRTPMWKQIAMFLGTVIGFWYLSNLFNRPEFPKIGVDLGPPQRPNDGVVHYTFDPVE